MQAGLGIDFVHTLRLELLAHLIVGIGESARKDLEHKLISRSVTAQQGRHITRAEVNVLISDWL